MRWLFLLLVLLNLGYYLWQQQQPSVVLKEEMSSISYPSGSSIRLLSEATEPLQPLNKSTSLIQTSGCLLLGGFKDSQEQAALQQKLAALNIKARALLITSPYGVDYWVYLPPLASKEAALRQIKALEAQSIEGFLIADGDLLDGISLGIFAQKEEADARLEQVNQAGYSAALRTLSRTQPVFWLRLDSEAQAQLSATLLQSLAAEFAGLQQQPLACAELDRIEASQVFTGD